MQECGEFSAIMWQADSQLTKAGDVASVRFSFAFFWDFER
jgi:hypothetical protein